MLYEVITYLVGKPVDRLVHQLLENLAVGRMDGEFEEDGRPVAVVDDRLQEVSYNFV